MKFIFGFKSDQLLGNDDWDYGEKQPLGGAETALLHIASTFRAQGHEVELINYPSSIAALRELMHGKECDIFINSRLPSGILALDSAPGALNYYWAHDDANQPLLRPLLDQPQRRRAFYQRVNGLFFLSQYQRAAWLSRLELVLEKTHLITNPIDLERFSPVATELKQRKRVAYYASTPYRGLEHLLLAWPGVRQSVADAELHVFSSLAVNGLPERPEHLALYERARQMPGVSYRGSVSQQELRAAAQQARVLAYPCCFPETSCIVAMEAMAAGAVVVGTELGALPETAWKNPMQPLTAGWLERWAVDVGRLLLEDDYYEDLALQNLQLAIHYDRVRVAQRMSHVFRRDFAALGIRVDAQLRRI